MVLWFQRALVYKSVDLLSAERKNGVTPVRFPSSGMPRAGFVGAVNLRVGVLAKMARHNIDKKSSCSFLITRKGRPPSSHLDS
jgi:hypothetical protein